MTLQRQPPIEIPLGTGLDESRGQLFRGPAALAECINGDHSQAPELRKRRGYTRLPLLEVRSATVDPLFVCAGVDPRAGGGGELVLVGRDHVYGVPAYDATVDGAALVVRGPSFVGAVRAGIVATSAIGAEPT